MIDPIIPLASSIGLKKGIYAFFLGSGVSKGAGVPTGFEIAREASKELYKLEKDQEEVDEDRFNQWLEEKDYTYSEVLEELFPTPADRRNFHEGKFKGTEPSQAHYELAQLVKDDYIKVIITTNFDPLMEKALDDKNVTYHSVTSDEEIENTPPREHTGCYILKLHGSWEKTNLKVTQGEVASLEPSIKKEFESILNRYGLVVLGYSGSDEAVMDSFQGTFPFYGLYWVVRGHPNNNVEQLVRDKNGFFLQRNTADAFLSELTRKIQILEHERPEKRSPSLVASEMQSFVRKKDSVVIKKQIRDSYRKVESKVIELTNENNEVKDRASILEVIERVENASEELIAIGIPLIGNDLVENFNDLKKLVIRLREVPPRSGSTAILKSPLLVLHNAIKTWGTIALKDRDFEVLNSIFNISIPIPNEARTCRFDEVLYMIHYSETSRILTEDGGASGLTQRFEEKYSEGEVINTFSYSIDNWKRSLSQFQFLLSLYCTKSDICDLPLISVTNSTKDERAVWELIDDLRYDEEFCRNIGELFEESSSTFRDDIPARFETLVENIPARFGARPWVRLRKHLEDD